MGMYKIRFYEDVTLPFRKSSDGYTDTCDAGRDWIASAAMLAKLKGNEKIASKLLKVSCIDNFITNFSVTSPKKPAPSKNRLLFYNGSGGYGDNIMSWPITRILAGLGYEVSVVADPGNQSCWYHFPWIKSVLVLPLQNDTFETFDHYLLFDSLVNTYEHSDVKHPVDVILNKIGVEAEKVKPEMKVVQPVFTQGEMNALTQFGKSQLAIYQLTASDKTRSLPTNDSVFLLTKLAEEFPDYLWVAPFDPSRPEFLEMLTEEVLTLDGKPELNERGEKKRKLKYKNIVPKFFQNLRELWAVSSQAKVVVSPDSMMVHVAGSMGVPCVGLWGTFSPESRVKYYKNHVPVYLKDACRMSPCCCYTGKFPAYCPPAKDRTCCECLAAISPQHVIDAINSFNKVKK